MKGSSDLVSTDHFNPDVQKPCNLSTCVTIFGNFLTFRIILSTFKALESETLKYLLQNFV